MHIIAGLGNPGRKYEHTRHNVGFDVIDILTQKYDMPAARTHCKALVSEGRIGGSRIILARPQTYMNLSGESVVQLMQWYKAEPEQVLIVYDDIDLPEGKLRFREKGSAGTHNGMRNIIYLTGSEAFPRIRVGTGRPEGPEDLKDWVLSGFVTPEERSLMFEAYMRAADAAVAFAAEGPDAARRIVAEHNNASAGTV
ncbi:MAG: aminoacyl-tRNA hydrolase [Clostridia bacterium]|nr:aminoacyl-tRNA hydrolase [Clostridia bacterium]